MNKTMCSYKGIDDGKVIRPLCACAGAGVEREDEILVKLFFYLWVCMCF